MMMSIACWCFTGMQNSRSGLRYHGPIVNPREIIAGAGGIIGGMAEIGTGLEMTW
jgi:LytS/YehU family sensor histidine kinase